MTTVPIPVRSQRRSVLLAVASAALIVAVAVLPEVIARLVHVGAGVTAGVLPETVRRGFDVWVASGSSDLPPDLASATSFWMVFHVVKAMLAVAALTALVMLQGRTWTAYSSATSRRRRIGLGISLVLETIASALVMMVALANVQGSISPLSSVLSFLPAGEPTPAMIAMREQITSGAMSPAASVLAADFRTYHLVVVVGSALLGLGLIFAGVVIRMRWAGPSTRRVVDLVLADLVLAAGLGFLGLVLLANLSTVMDTVPALTAFLGGPVS